MMFSISPNLSKWFFAAALLASLSACRQSVQLPIAMTVAADRDKITIGESFILTAKVNTGKDISVEDFNPVESLSQSFEVKDYKLKDSNRLFGGHVFIYRYKLSTFTTGKYEIPPLVLRYKKSGETDIKEFKSSPISITVESVPAKSTDTDDIRDLKSIAQLPVSKVWLVLGLVCVLLSAAYFVWRRYAERKASIISEVKEDERPCEDIAFERLNALKDSALLQEGNIKEYYSYLSEIIRQYLEKRYGIDVLDRTTLELYKLLRETDIERKIVTEIKTFLEEADLVKFAKYIPGSNDIASDWENAREIVEKTKPVRAAIEEALLGAGKEAL
jgi:cell division protein FtsL